MHRVGGGSKDSGNNKRQETIRLLEQLSHLRQKRKSKTIGCCTIVVLSQ
jgi:hypothetical protein